MLGTEMLTTMLAYNHAANSRLLDLVAALGEAQLDTPIADGSGTIRETLVHLVGSEWRWRVIVETHDPPVTPAPVPKRANIAELKRFAECEAGAIQGWLADQCEQELAAQARMIWCGDTVLFTPWHALVQLCMQGVQRRYALAMTLAKLNLDLGDLDFISFVDPD